MPVKGNRRSLDQMMAGAIQSQKEDEVARLEAELAALKAQPGSSTEILVDEIVPLRLPDNLNQPRRYFDIAKLEKLQDSIAKHGVLEPIMVRAAADGKYETISGERRWRCCAALGQKTIPATVRKMDDEAALEIAIISQLLNEGISMIEQTDSIVGLLRLRLGKSFDEVTRFLHAAHNYLSKGIEGDAIKGDENKIGIVEAILEEFGLKIGSFVSNRLPLLKMPDAVLTAVREGQISPSNAQLVAKQPEDWHEQLLIEAQQLTKAELQQRIHQIRAEKIQLGHRETGPSWMLPEASTEQASADELETAATEKQLEDYVFEGIKAIRRKKQLLDNKRIRTRMRRIAKELIEIKALAKQQGVEI